MGTSKNEASPDTPPWKPALAVLGRKGISPSRQAQEIWRSASAERGPRLLDDFSAAPLATACGLAQGATGILEALNEYDAALVEDRKSGFAAEIGRRALTRAVSSRQGSQGFAVELFSEATAYYASRDLPSFVGARNRIETISAAIDLKAQLKSATGQMVSRVGIPATDPEGWVSYVQQVLNSLQGRR